MILSDEDYMKVMECMPVVCVDAVVVNNKNEYLLVKRKNDPLKGEFWVPGGRLFKGEKAAEAIVRKMREELGIEVKVEKNLGYFEEFFDKTAQNIKTGFHAISLVFLVKPMSGDIKLDSQSSDWGWFKELPPLLDSYGIVI